MYNVYETTCIECIFLREEFFREHAKICKNSFDILSKYCTFRKIDSQE